MKQRNKYLAKNTGLLALGNLGTKLINFFLVPLYTSILNTSEYGTIDLISTVCAVFVPLSTLGIGEAIMRFALDKDADYEQIMSIGWLMLIISSGLSILVIPISNLFASTRDYRINIFFMCLAMGYHQVASCNLRGREQLLDYSIVNILNSAFIAGLNILLLVILKRGMKGYFMAYTYAYAITALVALFRGHSFHLIHRLTINKALMKSMLAYSIVLIPTTLMWWIMNSFDRVMVTVMISASANGVYAVSYKIPTILATFATIFNQAWGYSAIHEAESEDRETLTNKMYVSLANFLILCAGFFIATMKLILKYYVNEKYYIAWSYTPYLLIGFVFMTLASFMATAYTVNKDSKGFLYSGVFGAILNLMLNFILIPLMGVAGAALATCCSYLAVFAYRVVDTRKYIKTQIFVKKHLIGLSVLVLMSVTMFVDGTVGQAMLFAELFVLIIIGIFSRIE